jgi:hypothetical protein
LKKNHGKKTRRSKYTYSDAASAFSTKGMGRAAIQQRMAEMYKERTRQMREQCMAACRNLEYKVRKRIGNVQARINRAAREAAALASGKTLKALSAKSRLNALKGRKKKGG